MLLVVALLGATAAAFAVTERLKLEKTPITRTQVGQFVAAHPKVLGPPAFSPVCGCRTDRVGIWFFLRKADRVTVRIEQDDRTVDTLVDGKLYRRGWVRLSWDGVQPTGIVAVDGTYTSVVHLAREHRTIALPNPIRVDTTPPKVLAATAKPLLLSPDGDGRGDSLTVAYRLSEKGHGILSADRKRQVYGRLAGTRGTLRWYGKVDGAPLRPGSYALTFAAADEVGNVSGPVRLGTLTIRYVTLGRPLVSVAPRARFFIRVSADAKTVDFRFAGRAGKVHPGTITFRAPAKPGTYRLYVSVGKHAASAKVKVERIR